VDSAVLPEFSKVFAWWGSCPTTPKTNGRWRDRSPATHRLQGTKVRPVSQACSVVSVLRGDLFQGLIEGPITFFLLVAAFVVFVRVAKLWEFRRHGNNSVLCPRNFSKFLKVL
jgi:hypothetical protein